MLFTQILVARLSTFKELSGKIAEHQQSKARRANPAPNGLAAQAVNANNPSKEHYYEFLLESCERLFDNEVEQHAFEEQMRAVFGIQVRIQLAIRH